MELNEFTQLFPNEDCCYEYLSFWVKNICCTNCGSKGLVWHKETKRWECPVCGFVISLETMFSLLRDYFPYDAGEIIWQYNYLMKKQINHSTEDTNHTPTREKVVYGSTEGEYAGSSSHKCDIYIPNAPKAGTTYENVAGSTIIPGALITIGIGGILGGLFSTKSHTVYSSVFAPAEVARGNDMMVQVYVYKDGEHEQVIKDAISADDSTSERRKKYDPLYFKKWHFGSMILPTDRFRHSTPSYKMTKTSIRCKKNILKVLNFPKMGRRWCISLATTKAHIPSRTG